MLIFLSVVGTLASMVSRRSCVFCINFFYCLTYILMCSMLCYTMKTEKWEQDRARYGVRVITSNFLLSKRGFTFLFFRFLGLTVRLCRDLAFTKAVYLSCFTVSLSHCAPLKGFICHVSLIHNGEMREFSSVSSLVKQAKILSFEFTTISLLAQIQLDQIFLPRTAGRPRDYKCFPRLKSLRYTE